MTDLNLLNVLKSHGNVSGSSYLIHDLQAANSTNLAKKKNGYFIVLEIPHISFFKSFSSPICTFPGLIPCLVPIHKSHLPLQSHLVI